MGISIGIVGLPNVGKSTLFNIVANKEVKVSNYPFTTINPNKSTVFFEDKRLVFLKEKLNIKNSFPATIKYVDIAGIVKGASKGEGLGNQFLSHIREMKAIVHVVRCFEDPSIKHVFKTIDPIRDIEVITLELILADIQLINKHLNKLEKHFKIQKSKKLLKSIDLWNRVLSILSKEKISFKKFFTKEEIKEIKILNLLTIKPIIFFLNISSFNNNHEFKTIKDTKKFIRNKYDCKIIVSSLSFEKEINDLKKEQDKKELLKLLGLQKPNINNLIKESFSLLNFGVFYTFNKNEVKAWTFKNGMNAEECSYFIHSNIGKGFIKAEIFNFNDFVQYPAKELLKEKGLIKKEGKNYIVKDGDICYFHFVYNKKLGG